MEMEELYFKIEGEDGKDVLCRTILTFDAEEHSYVVFTLIDEEGNESEELSALRYELDENDEMSNLTPIESQEEWDMVIEVFNTIGGAEEDNTNYFSIETEEGEEKLCNAVHRFTLDGYDKNYLFYVLVDDENEDIYAASYTENEEGQVVGLQPIESEEEWKKAEKILQDLTNN